MCLLRMTPKDEVLCALRLASGATAFGELRQDLRPDEGIAPTKEEARRKRSHTHTQAPRRPARNLLAAATGNMDFFPEVFLDDKVAGSALEKQPSHGVAYTNKSAPQSDAEY